MATGPGKSHDVTTMLQNFIVQSNETNKNCPAAVPSDTLGMVTVEPIRRTLLNLDSRFFPMGIQPGDLVELKGPEGSGKTFTLTYLLARLLFVYPSQSVILIDTQHHFRLQNLISILSYFDSEIGPSNGHDLDPCPKLLSYLKRLLYLSCFTCEELLRIFQPQADEEQNCQLGSILLSNPAVSLVLIDTIDTFAYLSDKDQPTIPEEDRIVLQLIRDAVSPTLTPAICTRISDAAYTPRKPHGGGGRVSKPIDPTSSPHRQILVDEELFTQRLSLEPLAPQPLTLGQVNYKPFAERSVKEGEVGVWNKNVKTDCVAHLRSRSRHGNPNPGSGIIGGNRNHRVKFSIFSGMLWVFEEGKESRLGGSGGGGGGK